MKSEENHAMKNSKKAFTLVELVVVIAVLAVVAAIAIPTVTGIIASATESSGDEQARMLNEKCQLVHAEIKLGTINNTDSKNADGSAITYAGTKNASYSARTLAANKATVADVKEYAGLKSINCSNFYYCLAASSTSQYTKGTIYYSEDGRFPSAAGCGFARLADTTTLGILY